MPIIKKFHEQTYNFVRNPNYPKTLPIVLYEGLTYNIQTGKVTGEMKSTKLYAVPEALEFLKSIPYNLGSIGVTGPIRGGKSYLLSRILNTTDDFELGPTMNSCTRGIWISTTILVPKINTDQSLPAIILMDTEGIGSTASTSELDAAIATLSILFSSYFIYNSQGVPRAEDLQKLECFLNAASRLLKGVDNGFAELSKYFPHFRWVLRDQYLIPVINDRIVTPTEYLLNLLTVNENGLDEDPYKKTKKVLTQGFKSLSMECIQIPHQIPEIIQHMELQDDAVLIPEFIVGLEKVIVDAVRDTPFLTAIGSDSRLNGAGFATLFTKFIDLVNEPGVMPKFSTLWDSVMKNIFITAISDCVDEYRDFMKTKLTDNLPLDLVQLAEIHSQALNTSLALFNNKVDAYTPQREYYDMLQNQIAEYQDQVPVGGVYYEFYSQNIESSLASCELLLQELTTILRSKLHSEGYDFNQFVDDSSEIYARYDDRAIGPCAVEYRRKLSENIQNEQKFVEKLKGYSKKMADELKNKEEEFQKQLEEEKKRNDQNELIKQSLLDNRKMMESFSEHYEKMIIRAQEENAKAAKLQQEQFNLLLKTQGEAAANQMRLATEMMNAQQANMFAALEQNQRENAAALARVQQAIPTVSPPVHVARSRKRCSIM